MTPERWKRVEELYHAARTRPSGERVAFLADTCRDDEELMACGGPIRHRRGRRSARQRRLPQFASRLFVNRVKGVVAACVSLWHANDASGCD